MYGRFLTKNIRLQQICEEKTFKWSDQPKNLHEKYLVNSILKYTHHDLTIITGCTVPSECILIKHILWRSITSDIAIKFNKVQRYTLFMCQKKVIHTEEEKV